MATNGSAGNGKSANGHPPARKRPVSKAVYRRRRLVAGVIALILLAVVILGGVGIVKLLSRSGQDAAAPVITETTSPPAEATTPAQAAQSPSAQDTTPAVAKAAACTDAAVAVTASVDKESFAAGEDPTLTLKVTNTGATPCSLNVGTSQMEFKITSGDDAIFSSKDCQSSSTDLVKTIAAGKSETANFIWTRNRTAPGCAKVDSTPGGGGATYVYTALLGKKAAKQVLFQLQ